MNKSGAVATSVVKDVAMYPNPGFGQTFMLSRDNRFRESRYMMFRVNV